ncbi:conserved hypothetical protein [Cupriavidus taiwanensis]|uniref:hypothetical protein n=1 Tax=Cupriavidus taiwanensis TaxID=164546 RepID=UPI000E1943EF|nr:hypothetical protein [Cupriavidus taiwanensis]SOY79940.1 conserved hypothetical protein [Cupriavidus taiwanensis]SOY81909.1 conserved hypothetical protein [Cupriavidus taiwanensis]
MAKGGKRPGAGRPPGALNKATADVKAMAQEYGLDAIRELATILTTSESHQARIAAAKELLDRGYGKATQAVELGGAGGGPIDMNMTVEFVDGEGTVS